jgi:fumarate hydratase class II
MKAEFRIETDSMGEMRVPADAYYGAQTARAVENFPISGLRFPRGFIRALGLVKKHAAITNQALGLLDEPRAQAIEQAAQEVAEGKLDAQFVVDIFQTGSGTSTNMNANEVIATRACELMGGRIGDRSVHPNDHVNRGQSSNDVIPTAIHLAAMDGIEFNLLPALEDLRAALADKAVAFKDILKIGRTHLQDATPMRLGQEFSGYAQQIANGLARLRQAQGFLGELPLGGTAVGTGLNTHPEFATRTIQRLAEETRLPLREAPNHFEAQAARDACVETAGVLKTMAVSLTKIANDIRWLGSGPRLGLGELRLPSLQPGSSIMPGKVNPVLCETVVQVCAQVFGNETVVALAGATGAFELNTMMPVLAYNLLQAIELLANAGRVFAERCVRGLEADEERCRSNVERSLAVGTALVPAIGYDQALKIVKAAAESGRTVRQVAQEMSGLDKAELDKLLDPVRQAGREE